MAPREAPQKSIFGSQKWYFLDFPFRGFVEGRLVRNTITHEMITEPNFIIFELILVTPVLELPSRIVFGI